MNTPNLTMGKARANKWRTVCSNVAGHDLDMRLIDNFVRGWTAPTIGLNFNTTNYEGWQIESHEPDRNRGLYELNLTLAISEDWINYYVWVDWAMRVKKGLVNPNHGEYTMDSFTLFMLDSNDRERLGIKLFELQLVSVGAPSGVSGTSEELTVDLQFKAHDIEYLLIGVGNGTPGQSESMDRVPTAKFDKPFDTTVAESVSRELPFYDLPIISEVVPNVGDTDGETEITVIGNNFVNGMSFVFGSTPASGVVVVSPTEAKMLVRAGGDGVVDVHAINPDRRGASLVNGFRYIPMPAIVGMSPMAFPSAGGTTLTISGRNFQADAQVFVGGVLASETITMSQVHIECVTPPGFEGNATVTVVNPDGFSANAIATYF